MISIYGSSDFKLDLQSDQVSVNNGSSKTPSSCNEKGGPIKRGARVSGSSEEFTDVGKKLVDN